MLKEDKLYQFYNDYKFSYENDDPTGKIVSVIHESSIPDDLYKIGDLTINVSAIVGENGSGKSSLIDLFFAVVYNFSMNRGLLEIDERYITEELVLPDLKVQIIYELNDVIYVLDTRSISESKDKLEISILNTETSSSYAIQQKREFKIGGLTIEKEEDVRKFLLEHLFYTVAVNYSVYSLNNKHIGSWINHLFHKNDGYKAPIVINPMRDEGNFNINTELYLSKSRLLANIIHPDYIDKADTLKITEYQRIQNIHFNVDVKRLSNVVYTTPEKLHINIEDFYLWNGGKEVFLASLNDVFFKGKLLEYIKEVKYGEQILTYIVRKLFKIASKYDGYKEYVEGDYPKLDNYDVSKINDFEDFLRFKNFNKYLEKIYDDKSHVTFKLRQAINYLKFNQLKENARCVHKKAIGFVISAKELSNRIKELDTDENIINLLPPGLFEVDFELIDDTQKVSGYNMLSSGEQQLIQSTQSLAYHLINLNSVFNKPIGDERPTYNSVNLILDEIELYFHPNLQRKYIKHLLDTIARLGLDSIESVNILLVTHSPFILSDIPVTNTLRLKDKGEPSLYDENIETFGSNIHDLLANDFFLDEGFMGEFAKNWIENLIKYLKSDEGNDIAFNNKWNESKAKLIIGIVGEPILKMKLAEMYDKKFGNDFELELLEDRIRDIKKNRN